jgi:hypothetical protein
MLMYQWVLIPLDSLQTLRLSQQWRKTILEPKRTWDWVFDMDERKWADFLKYNVLFRALVPEIRFGKGVPNQFQGFKLFRNVEPELVFCKGKKGNLGGEKEPWGVGWVFSKSFQACSNYFTFQRLVAFCTPPFSSYTHHSPLSCNLSPNTLICKFTLTSHIFLTYTLQNAWL